ncbi:hypothetical protein GCM10010495_48950 [Kitasatospora herbaricolor]|nr:hypothetical protein [Kitasatospora herbaricolor]GGV27091.1 hypothetical protein GCM10010495_48950 [Kitasatospora herbaricolor]
MTRREDPQAPRRDWLDRALCRERDPELFFPVGNQGPALLQIDEAKAVCRPCPVRPQCLLWALETNQESGVWGGVSEDELLAIRTRAARARHRTKEASDAKDAKETGRDGQRRRSPTAARFPALA